MRRSLLVFALVLFHSLANSQVKLVGGVVNSGCATTVDIPIRVANFTNMLSMQGTIHWNTTYLSYNSIVNYGPASIGLNNGNFGFGSTGLGNLMFSWNDGNLSGETLADSTNLLVLRFNVVGSGNFSTSLSFQNSPTPLEFVNLTYNTIPYVTISGAVNRTCATCAINSITASTQTACNLANNFYTQALILNYTAPPSTGSISVNGQLFPITGSPQTVILDSLVANNNPVNVSAFFTSTPGCVLNVSSLFNAPVSCQTNTFTIFADSVYSGCTPTIDVPIRVNNFVNMLSAQGTISWDVTNLTFNSITNFGPPVLGLNNANFGLGSLAAGKLLFSWNDGNQSSETLADSTILFTIRYNVTISEISNTPISFVNVPAPLEFVNNTYAPIPYFTNNGNVDISCSNCNFSAITAGVQGACNPSTNLYTQQVIVSYGNAPTSGNLSVNGQLFPILGSPQTVLLNNLISDGNSVSVQAFFTADPTCAFSASQLFIAPATCLVSPVNMFSDQVSDTCTNTIDVPVRVNDFVNMLSFQGTIHWNEALLNFNSIVDYGPASLGLNSGNFGFGNIASGNLMYSWNDANLSGESLADSTILFTLRFNVIGTGNFNTPISFVNSPTPAEFVNLSFTPIPYSLTNGSVNIFCPPANEIDLFFTDYACLTDSVFTVDVTANNFTNIVSYQGTVKWDTAHFAFDNITYYGPSNVLMNAGNFGLPLVSDGMLTFSWYDSDLSGEYLPDSTILFSFEIHAIDSFSCTNIDFDDAPTPLEFIDSLMQEVPTFAQNLTVCRGSNAYVSVQLCAGDSVLIGGVYQYNPGVYIDTLLAITGCDSIVNYTLTLLPANLVTDSHIACDAFTWIDGNTYTASNNTATWVLSNAIGCDSTIILDLTILNSTSSTDVQSACGSYTWIDGNTYTVSNNSATWVLTNAAGCDSIITLDLTILNSSSTVPSISIIASQSTICAATTQVVYTASATNGGTNPSYQWYKNGVAVGTNSPTYVHTSPVTGDAVYCVLTSNAFCVSQATATSNTITLSFSATTVTPFVSINISPVASCDTTAVTLTAIPTNGGINPQFVWKKNGSVVGTNSAVYSDPSVLSSDVITVDLVSNASCVNPTTAIGYFSLSYVLTWTGAVDNDWHKPCNWNYNQVPHCCNSVIIPLTTNQPIISGVAACNDITIFTTDGAIITVANGANLQVQDCPVAVTVVSCP